MADKRRLADMLSEIALLLEFKGENPFKIRAYQSAAHTLEQFEGELTSLMEENKVADIKGIGKTIAGHVAEYLKTGDLSYYNELKESVPLVLFELVKIPGLGPKKAVALHEKLSINSIGELEYACRENRLLSLPGFGAKTQEFILRGIEYVKKSQGQFLLSDAWPVAEKIAEYLANHEVVVDARVAGSIRRRKEVVKDLDIVVASQMPEQVMEIVVNMPGVQRVVSRGATKTAILLTTGMNLDVRVVAPEEFVYALHHFTGSKEHHVELRGLAKEGGYKINEYGIESVDGRRIDIQDEQNFYTFLGLQYIEPELREGTGEIAAAARQGLPKLVEADNIKGALHVHTTYSDGSATLAEMATAAKERGWRYLGITDHSQTAVYARGLKPERLLEQRQEIERLNAADAGFTILAGIESDILPDGSLDYPDEILANFDFVIASVHSAFRQSETEKTRRIIKAMENSYVSILGHPTGRILLAREGYALDMPAIIQAAKDTGTIIEINANPYRLDLDWRWCRLAKEQGLLLAVDPDAHAVNDLEYMRYGLAVARKGWLAAKNIINTREVDELVTLLRRKRK